MTSQMEPESPVSHGVPPYLNSHYLLGCGGASIPDQQRSHNPGRKKSKVRLNDQLIPKPTDINMAEKMIKMATPKCHPYSSHISQFAMFPSFRSPEDPEPGNRAAQPFLIPHSAPHITLLSKTKGSPFRHEVLETPMKTRKKAVMWTEGHSFLNQTKPFNGENHVFYAAPAKTNPKLHDRDLWSSERTRNMLQDLERSRWVTSYQMHHTGSGRANHLKINDIEKNRSGSGMNPHTAPPTESSSPVCVTFEPRGGCRRRLQGSTCRTAAAELLNLSQAPNRSTATVNQRRPQEITASNAPPDPSQTGLSQSKNSSVSLHKPHTESKSSAYEDRGRDNRQVQFGENPTQDTESQSSQEANAARIVGPASEQEMLAKGRELPHSSSDPFSRSRPPALPGIHPVDGLGTVGRESTALCLLDLQNSFSKSNAHHNFNSSITRAAVNPRDNVVTGRKHDFYGINCYYLHG